jgi:hypothetical protein
LNMVWLFRFWAGMQWFKEVPLITPRSALKASWVACTNVASVGRAWCHGQCQSSMPSAAVDDGWPGPVWYLQCAGVEYARGL